MSRRPADLPIERLLAAIRAHGSVAQACRDLGVVERTFTRRYVGDPALGARVEEARRVGRDATFVHGAPGSGNRCRCDICKFSDAMRRQKYSGSTTGQPCDYCGRIVGVRNGKRYGHHSEPGIVCPGSQRSHGSVRATERAS